MRKVKKLKKKIKALKLELKMYRMWYHEELNERRAVSTVASDLSDENLGYRYTVARMKIEAESYTKGVSRM